ncbi:TPA: hypothetical protein QFP12_002386, partial [Enterococcus faecium]
MKRSKNLILLFLIFSVILIFTSKKVDAAPHSLTGLGYFHWANEVKTPADNTFIMHYSDDLSVEPIEGIANTSFIEVNRNTNKSKALVKNVGFYKGKKVNLLITLE